MVAKCYYNAEGKRRYYYEHRREAILKNRYGIGVADFDRMVELQENRCAICKKEAEKNMDVDHCHATGKVRGLLCNNCNRALGHFKDSVENLKAAVEYLSRDISGKGGSCGS